MSLEFSSVFFSEIQDLSTVHFLVSQKWNGSPEVELGTSEQG